MYLLGLTATWSHGNPWNESVYVPYSKAYNLIFVIRMLEQTVAYGDRGGVKAVWYVHVVLCVVLIGWREIATSLRSTGPGDVARSIFGGDSLQRHQPRCNDQFTFTLLQRFPCDVQKQSRRKSLGGESLVWTKQLDFYEPAMCCAIFITRCQTLHLSRCGSGFPG